MSENDQIREILNMLLEKGIPEEVIQKLSDGTLLSSHSYAEGGKGQAVNITYVDNYSTLLLVYVFLLNSLDKSEKNEDPNSLNKSLLSTLKMAMKEQQEFRKAFLAAVNSLRK